MAEAVWVMTGVDLLTPANFCGGRKAGGVEAGGETKGSAVGTGAGAGPGESKVIVKTGRKGWGTLRGGSEGPKSAG